MASAYERYCIIRDERGFKDADVAKGANITKSTFSDWKAGRYIPKPEKMQKIADFFKCPLSYFLLGNMQEASQELNVRDRRDIAKDLDRIIAEIKSGDDGPLFYNGEELDEASLALLNNAIEYALTQAKKENKVKYNPNKNKK